MGIVSERDVFTTLIMTYGKTCVIVASPTLLYTMRRFSYSLSQVRGIASLQPRHNGDSVYSKYIIIYAYTAHHSYAIIAQFGNSNGKSR